MVRPGFASLRDGWKRQAAPLPRVARTRTATTRPGGVGPAGDGATRGEARDSMPENVDLVAYALVHPVGYNTMMVSPLYRDHHNADTDPV